MALPQQGTETLNAVKKGDGKPVLMALPQQGTETVLVDLATTFSRC